MKPGELQPSAHGQTPAGMLPLFGGRSPTIVSSRTLLAGQPELLIEHDQQIYRLRQTAQGKLILTK